MTTRLVGAIAIMVGRVGLVVDIPESGRWGVNRCCLCFLKWWENRRERSTHIFSFFFFLYFPLFLHSFFLKKYFSLILFTYFLSNFFFWWWLWFFFLLLLFMREISFIYITLLRNILFFIPYSKNILVVFFLVIHFFSYFAF